MSLDSGEAGAREDASDGEEPLVPEGVLRGIEDVEEGNTASKEDIESVLKF